MWLTRLAVCSSLAFSSSGCRHSEPLELGPAPQIAADAAVASRAPRAIDAAPPAPERPDDLVDAASLDGDLVLEMRYAAADNFAGEAVYPPGSRCLLRRRVAAALIEAEAALEKQGYRIKLWDCYRPFSVQEKFWRLVPDPRYVARPRRDAAGKPASGSKHNRGAAVDLTLVDAAGNDVEMPTEHDDFSARAHRGSKAWSAAARRHAAILDRAMKAAGFSGIATEWWHYDGPGWRDFPLSDEPL